MDGIFVVFVFSLRGFGCATNIDSELCDIKCPVLGSYFGVGFYTIAVGFVDGIGVVFASLDRLCF